MNFYQLMNGDINRDYSEICFTYGIACVGPGDKGRLPENQNQYTESELGKIWYMTQMKEGDCLILKSGVRDIVAVGIIECIEGNTYNYSDNLQDVEGWDLQHYVNVKWKKVEYKFENRVLTRSTLTQVNSEEVRKKAIDILENDKIPFLNRERNIRELSGLKFNYTSFLQRIIETGIEVSRARQFVKAIENIELLGKWYLDNITDDKRISEHEIRTHMVIPFIKALGWSEQKIEVENQSIDIMLYSDAFRKCPAILIETKSFWIGLESAAEQAFNYAKRFPNLNTVLCTDGLRYYLYKKTSDKFELSSYFNLLSKFEKHPLMGTKGGMSDLITGLLQSSF